MKIDIFFLESDTKFTKKYKLRLEKIIRDTAKNNVKTLDLSRRFINFTVYPYEKFSDGWTMTKYWIALSIPKNFPKKDLIGLISHEMHHIKIGHYFYSKRKTFLETLFFEGLAIAFQIEQSKKISRYCKYNKNLLKKWLPVLKKQDLSSKKYDYYEWFWGTGKLPKSLGYKLGRYLIDQVQKNFPKLTIIDMTKKNPKDLLKLSGVKLK